MDRETDTVVRRDNWYYADDEPVQLGLTYADWNPVADNPVGTSADLGPGSPMSGVALLPVTGQHEDMGRDEPRLACGAASGAVGPGGRGTGGSAGFGQRGRASVDAAGRVRRGIGPAVRGCA